MSTRGYDLFYEEEKGKDMYCNVCGTKCNVERDKTTKITNMATAIKAKIIGKNYDEFTCPNTDKNWHQKARKLMIEKDDTESGYITELIDIELKEILQKNLKGGTPVE